MFSLWPVSTPLSGTRKSSWSESGPDLPQVDAEDNLGKTRSKTTCPRPNALGALGCSDRRQALIRLAATALMSSLYRGLLRSSPSCRQKTISLCRRLGGKQHKRRLDDGIVRWLVNPYDFGDWQEG